MPTNKKKYIKPAIYCIDNLVTKKYYIGSAKYFPSRKHTHLARLRKGTHDNSHLQSSFIKYGEKNFIFSIIENCTLDNLLEREQYWIDSTKCTDRKYGYNILKIAGSRLGTKHTEETKRKISEYQKANPRPLTKKQRDIYRNNIIGKWSKYCKENGNPLKGKKRPDHGPMIQKAVLQLDLEGNVIKEWESSKAAALELGIYFNSIKHVIYGIRNSCKGFKWKYK